MKASKGVVPAAKAYPPGIRCAGGARTHCPSDDRERATPAGGRGVESELERLDGNKNPALVARKTSVR